MKHILPHQLDYRRLKPPVHLEGSVQWEQLERIKDLIQGIKHNQVSLDINLDEKKRVVISGKIEAELILQCQRCLLPMDYLLNSVFSLLPVHTAEQAENLPDQLEPIWMENEKIDIWGIVAEEILLNLPLVPRHFNANDPCVLQKEDKNLKKDFKNDNPFSKLSDLKKQLSK